MTKENNIDTMDTFVFTSDKVHANLYSVIVDLDLIIRSHSGPPHAPSIEHLTNNKDAFEKDALSLLNTKDLTNQAIRLVAFVRSTLNLP